MSEKEKKGTPKFSKQQFMKAANFTRVERDALRFLMKDNETYTLEQAQKMLADYAKRKVT